MFAKITTFASQLVNHVHELFASSWMYAHNMLTNPITIVHNFVANVAHEIRVLLTKTPVASAMAIVDPTKAPPAA